MKITYALLIAILITILIVPTINLVARASEKEAKLVGGDSCSRCSCPCSQYPIMYPDQETLQAWLQCYNRAPHAYIDPELEPPTGSVSLLSHLEYDPVERDQGSCGNCWAWAGTGVLEIALDVQEGVLDRLSMQYLNSKYNGGTGSDWACCGGWLEYLADFYASEGFTIPWSNTNASWADGTQTCADGTTVPWQTISTSPNYSITTCTAESITTHGVGQTEAINNIKNVLAQDKAIWFGYFLPTGADWAEFISFWNYELEDVIWNPDYSCGHSWDDGGGHAVLCVGYDDTDPVNSYWIMVNSWGTAYGGRPNGIFHLDMDMDYDCYFYDPYPVGWYSFYWQTLDVAFDVITPPTIINHTPSGTEVPVTTTITVTFSEAMNHTSAENAFSVSPSVSGSFSWSGNTMTFTPSSLAYGTTYELTIGKGAMDSAGNPLGSPYSWEFTTTADTIKRFDFGTDSSPVETEYTRITTSTLYSISSDYGWDSSTGLGSRDRGSPDNLRRDLVFSSVDRTFKVDVTNGAYLVMVIVGDQSYMHNNIRIYAEDVLKSTVSTSVGEFVQKVFVVSVADGTLDLMFQDDGGSDSNWVINAILIKPYSESKFDFGTEGSPVESGYTQVLSSTSYSGSTGYGWADTVDLYARDRGAPDSLRRDFVFSSSNKTFNIDLPNGKYMVVIIIGDNSYSHDYIHIYCEGILVASDLCVGKGYFAEVAFPAEVSDDQLEIMFCDDGGANAHWMVNSIHTKTTFDLRLKFDFGTSSSPVEDGYVRVTPTTAYLPSTSYGWSDITDLWSRDRGAPDALRRDLVFSNVNHTFNVDLSNGKYQVTLIVGDQNHMHDKIDIYAEDVLVADDIATSAGAFTEIIFTVTVNDGQLNISFHDDGGSDSNWVINSVTIESYQEDLDTTPPTITITSPEEGATLSSADVTVTWTGSDAGSGIDYYEVRLDSGSWIDKGTSASHTFTSLSDDEHTVDVRAWDNAGKSNTDSVTFTVDTSGPPPEVVKWAVIVGISDYKAINDLSYCDEDATDWYNHLSGTMDYDYIWVYGDSHPSNYPQYDGYATEYNVKQALQNVVNQADSDDIIVFTTSGHGSGNGLGSSYLCMWDCSSGENGEDGDLYDTELANILGDAVASRVFVFIDHCYAGGFGDDLMNMGNSDHVYLTTTCTENGYGWDDSAHENGLWTYYFLEYAWINHFGADANVSMEDVFDYAHDHYPYGGDDEPQEYDGDSASPFYLT